jgi:polyferredoxin
MNNIDKQLNHRVKLATITTLIALAIPFIKFGGYHLLLFNFYDYRFELLFRAYEVSAGYLTAIFILFAVGVILVFNFTYSRYFCGNICPKTLMRFVLTDFIEGKIFKITKIKNRQQGEKISGHAIKTSLSYLLFAIFVLIATLPFFFYLIPYNIFFDMASNGFKGYFIVLIAWLATSIYLFAEALFFKEFFCSYICPYQLVNSITINDKKSFYNFNNKSDCISCNACVKICPVPNLDIKNGFDTRCIACGDCSAICADVMENEGKNYSLINYTNFENISTKDKLFSFAERKLSIILTIIAIIGIGVVIAYISNVDNVDYCNFSNASLYE